MWTKLCKLMQSMQSMQSMNQKGSYSSSEWKWEVNHDGVIWSWTHTLPSALPSLPQSQSQSPIPNPNLQSPISNPQSQSPSPQYEQRASLVDYWYIVHDGVVIPGINDV